MKEAFLLVAGLNIFYAAEGKGPPILYIHGNTGSSRWFSKVMDIPGYKTLALDLPNFGRSPALSVEADIHVYADYVKQFIDAARLEQPVVVGHSLGGAVAQSLALRYPESLRALVLVDSSSPKGLLTPKDRHPLIEMMRKDKGMLAQALAATTPALQDKALFESLVDDAAAMAEKAWIGNAEALSRFDVSELTPKFQKPVLVLWGRNDFIVTELMARETAQAYGGAVFEIYENVGHSVIVEAPQSFKDSLLKFLAKIELK